MSNTFPLSAIKVRIACGRFMLGLGVIALGAGIAGFASFFQTSPPITAASLGTWPLLGLYLSLLTSFIVIIAGAAILYTAPQEICSACNCRLDYYKTSFPISAYDNLVRWMSESSPKALTDIRLIPTVNTQEKQLATVDYSVCPHCRKNGWLLANKTRFDDKRQEYIPFESSELFVRSGETLEQFIRIAETRELHGKRS